MTYEEKRAYLESFEEVEKRCAEIRAEIGMHGESTELIGTLKREEANLTEHLRRIENALYSLPDIRARRILWLKYIGEIKDGKRERLKRLWQIANKMGYAEETIKKVHSDAIKNIEFGEG